MVRAATCLPVLVLALLAGGLPAAHAEDAAKDAPKSGAAPKPVDAKTAIRRGVDYLVASQRKDGSWGSPASNLHDIYAPAPGSQRAFQVGSAGLAVSALVEHVEEVAGFESPGPDDPVIVDDDHADDDHHDDDDDHGEDEG